MAVLDSCTKKLRNSLQKTGGQRRWTVRACLVLMMMFLFSAYVRIDHLTIAVPGPKRTTIGLDLFAARMGAFFHNGRGDPWPTYFPGGTRFPPMIIHDFELFSDGTFRMVSIPLLPVAGVMLLSLVPTVIRNVAAGSKGAA